MDIDIKKLKEDAHGQEVKDEINSVVEDAKVNDITGTPTFVFGMKKFVGINSFPEYRQQIINLGGREKQNHG